MNSLVTGSSLVPNSSSFSTRLQNLQEIFKNSPERCVAPNLKEFKQALQSYLSLQETAHPSDQIIGFYEKQELPQDGTIIVRADLHGEPGSVLAMLQEAQKKGILDQDFKICSNFLGKVKFVFLGDYTERGKYNTISLCMMLEFKCLNPESVVLIRGNHEDEGFINAFQKLHDEQQVKTAIPFAYALENVDEELKSLMHAFYRSLPLGVVIAQEGQDDLGFFHAAVDPAFNFQELRVGERKYITKSSSEHLYDFFLPRLSFLNNYLWQNASYEEIGEINFSQKELEHLKAEEIDPELAKSVIRIHNLFKKIIVDPSDQHISVEDFLFYQRNDNEITVADLSDRNGDDYVSYNTTRNFLGFSSKYYDDVTRLLHMHCFFGHRHRNQQEFSSSGYSCHDLTSSFHALHNINIRNKHPYADVSYRICNREVEIFTVSDQNNIENLVNHYPLIPWLSSQLNLILDYALRTHSSINFPSIGLKLEFDDGKINFQRDGSSETLSRNEVLRRLTLMFANTDGENLSPDFNERGSILELHFSSLPLNTSFQIQDQNINQINQIINFAQQNRLRFRIFDDRGNRSHLFECDGDEIYFFHRNGIPFKEPSSLNRNVFVNKIMKDKRDSTVTFDFIPTLASFSPLENQERVCEECSSSCTSSTSLILPYGFEVYRPRNRSIPPQSILQTMRSDEYEQEHGKVFADEAILGIATITEHTSNGIFLSSRHQHILHQQTQFTCANAAAAMVILDHDRYAAYNLQETRSTGVNEGYGGNSLDDISDFLQESGLTPIKQTLHNDENLFQNMLSALREQGSAIFPRFGHFIVLDELLTIGNQKCAIIRDPWHAWQIIVKWESLISNTSLSQYSFIQVNEAPQSESSSSELASIDPPQENNPSEQTTSDCESSILQRILLNVIIDGKQYLIYFNPDTSPDYKLYSPDGTLSVYQTPVELFAHLLESLLTPRVLLNMTINDKQYRIYFNPDTSPDYKLYSPDGTLSVCKTPAELFDAIEE